MSETAKYVIYARRLNPKKSQRFPSMLKNFFNFKWIKGIFDMKKIALLLFVLIIVLNGCRQVSESGAKETKKETKSLSDLQVTACNTAHEAGTCDTRLAELGIVLKEDCCEVLGKCC